MKRLNQTGKIKGVLIIKTENYGKSKYGQQCSRSCQDKYNKEELEEFRQIILEKLEKARADLALLTEAYSNVNENDTNDTSPTFKVLEEGYNVLSKEENSRLAVRQQKFITNLENALIRIENGTYGIVG